MIERVLSNMVVGLVAGALLTGCGAPEPRARRSLGGARPSADFVEGQRLFRELRYREAEVCFRRAHEAEPQDREILDFLTRVELLSCSKPSCFRTCDRGVAIELEKAEVRRLFDDGQALLDGGDVSRAITRFELVLEKLRWFPYQIDDEGWKERAEQLLATARPVQPATTAAQPHSGRRLGGARPVETQELEGLQREGEALLDAGEVELAIARFERVLKRLRRSPYVVDDGSLKTRAEERLSAARAALEWPLVEPRSPRAEPTHPDFVEGMRHYEAFDYAQAAACFRRACQAEPEDRVIRQYMLQAELLAGEREAEFELLR